MRPSSCARSAAARIWESEGADCRAHAEAVMARETRAVDAEEEDDLAEEWAALEANDEEEAAAEEVAVGARIAAGEAAVAESATVAEGGEEEEEEEEAAAELAAAGPCTAEPGCIVVGEAAVAEEAAVADDTPPAGVLLSAKSATKCLAKRRHMSPWYAAVPVVRKPSSPGLRAKPGWPPCQQDAGSGPA